MHRSTRILALLGLVLATTALSACGAESPTRFAHAETEGTYLEIGGLLYQVQFSRLLNPSDTEDRGYLVGLPDSAKLGNDETYFAIFLLAQNEEEHPIVSSDDMQIHDTQGNVFKPIDLRPTNLFAYEQELVPPGEEIPRVDSPAAEGPAQGSLLIFKLPNKVLGNRPLELEIKSAEVPLETGVIGLDV